MSDPPSPADDRPTAPETPSGEPPVGRPPGEDWETRFKYLFADFENFRRRTERERESIGRQSRAAMLRDLLPLLEAFRSAHASAVRLPEGDALRRGIELLDREWERFLKHQGIEPVAAVGAPFRSDEAEAVGETAPGAGAEDGTVAEIVQQGYRFFGGLLRPAKVIVARRSRPAVPAEPTGADASAAGGEAP